MKKSINKWFTLVELIVVITILAILWTIAFISLQWYSKTARDSTRISDMSRIKTSLELFMVEWWKYPEPIWIVPVTYSGTLNAWDQGTFWETTFRNVDRLDKVPVDPVTEKEYTYSVTNNRKEYQLAGILETQDFVMDSPHLTPLPVGEGIATRANAWETKAIARITWSYNWSILKVVDGQETNILAVPSIICSEDLTLEECINQNKLAYDGYSNLPSNFSGTQFNHLWEGWSLNLVNEANLLIFKWKTADLSEDTTEWKAARKVMVENLKAAYSSTKIVNREAIRKLVNVDINDDTAVENLAVWVVTNKINRATLTTSGISVASNTKVVYSDCVTIEQDWYTTPDMLHWESGELTKTWSVINWLENFTNTFTCNNWLYEWSNEASSIECDGWYSLNDIWECVFDPKIWLWELNLYKVNGKTDARIEWENVIIWNTDSYNLHAWKTNLNTPLLVTDLLTWDFELSFNSSSFWGKEWLLWFTVTDENNTNLVTSWEGWLAEYANYASRYIARKWYTWYSRSYSGKTSPFFNIKRVWNIVTACVSNYCSSWFSVSWDIKAWIYYAYSDSCLNWTDKTLSNFSFTWTPVVPLEIEWTTCLDIKNNNPDYTDWVYKIDPENNWEWFEVYCDMTTDWGWWTLYAYSNDYNSIDFTRWLWNWHWTYSVDWSSSTIWNASLWDKFINNIDIYDFLVTDLNNEQPYVPWWKLVYLNNLDNNWNKLTWNNLLVHTTKVINNLNIKWYSVDNNILQYQVDKINEWNTNASWTTYQWWIWRTTTPWINNTSLSPQYIEFRTWWTPSSARRSWMIKWSNGTWVKFKMWFR